MKMRKLIAVFAAVLMLCAMLPLGALAVAADDNLLQNGGFETGDLTGWYNLWNSCSVGFVQGRESNHALDFESGKWQQVRQDGVPVEKNTHYVLSAWVKNAINFTLMVKKGNDSANIAEVEVPNSTEWTKYEVHFNSANETSVCVLLIGNEAGAVAVIDDVRLEKGDGSVLPPPDEPEEPEEPVIEVKDNILSNGGFETGKFDGWDQGWYNPAISSGVVHEGKYSLKSSSATSLYQTIIKSQKIKVQPNTDYAVTLWYYYDGTSPKPSFFLYAKDGGNSVNLGYASPIPEETKTWYRVQMTFNTGAYSEILLLLQNNTTTGGTYYFDDIQMGVHVDENAVSGVELVPNGTFEDGREGWATLSGTTVSNKAAHGGSQSIRTTNTASNWQTMLKSDPIAVQGGAKHKFSFWYYYDGSTANASFYFYIKDGANSYNIAEGILAPEKARTWYYAECVFDMADEPTILILLQNRTVGDGGVYYFDDISLIGPEKGDDGGDDEEAVEMLQNGDFETGDKTGWNLNSGTRLNNVVTHGGNYSVATGNTATAYQVMMSQFFKTTIKKQYTITFWYCYDGSYSQPAFHLFVKNGDKSKDLASGTFTAEKPNTWYQATLIFNSGENEDVAIFLQNKTAGAGGTYYFDDFSVMGPAFVSVQQPSFDGYITNGDFEMGDTQGFADYAGTTVSNVVAHGGKYALASTNTASQYQSLTKINPIEVNPNTVYKVTFWYYYSGSSASPSLYLFAQDVTNKINIHSVTLSPKASGTWYEGTMEFETGDYMQVSLVWQNRTAGSGGTYYLDDIVMERIPDETPFDDGNVTNGGFETGDKTGWTIYQETVINSTAAYGGSYGAMLGGTGGWGSLANQVVKVSTDTAYDVSMWVRTLKTGVNIEVRDGKGGTALAQLKYTDTKWTNVVFRVTSTTGELYINCFGLGGGAAEVVYLDNVSVRPSPLVVNGSFESGDQNGWTADASTVILPVASYEGTFGASLTSKGDSKSLLSQSVQVTAGKSYTVSAWVKAVSGGIAVAIKDGSATATVLAQQDYSGTAWSRLVYIVTPTTDTLYLDFAARNNGAGATVYVDDVAVIPLADDGHLVNGDFETGTTAYWTTYYDTIVSADAFYQGDYGLQLVGPGNWDGLAYQDFETEIGEEYNFSGYFKALSGGVNIQIVNVADGKVLKTMWFDRSGWTKMTTDFIATGTKVRVNVCGAGNNVATTVYADTLTVIKLKDPSFDGYIYNGDFEAGSLTKWEYYSDTEVTAEAAYSGDYGVRIKGNADWGGLLTQRFTVEPGKTYQLTMRYKPISNGVNVTINSNKNGQLHAVYYNSKHTTSWSKYTVTFEAGNSTQITLNFSGSGIGLSQSGAGTRDEVWIDDIVLVNLSGDEMDRSELLTFNGNSIRDTVDNRRGLAFRFTADITGVKVEGANRLVDGSGMVKIYKYSDQMCALVEVGAVVSNNSAVSHELSLDAVDGKKTVRIPVQYLMEWSETSIDYAIRIVDIPDSGADVAIYVRPYYTYELDGEQITIYGETVNANYNEVEGARRSLKVLAIGDGLADDAVKQHLYDVFKSADYDQVIIGHLYANGASLDDHWNNISANAAVYTYEKNDDNGTWVTNPKCSVLSALQEERWDVVVLQQAAADAANAASYGNLKSLVDWIDTNKTDPDTAIYWQTAWADNDAAYKAISAVAESTVMTTDGIDGILPVGTAIANLRTTALDDDLIINAQRLADSYGDYTAALTWFVTLTGESLDQIDYRPESILAHHYDVARAAAHAAYKPYAITDLTETVLFAGSDFQPVIWEDGVALVQDLLGTLADEGYGLFDGFFAVGDYASSTGHEVSTVGLSYLDKTVSEVVKTNKIYTEGNHDAPTTVGLAPYGNNDPRGGTYGVFVIHEENYGQYGAGGDQVAKDLTAYLTEKATNDSWGKKPIFVLTHVPLHYSRRAIDERCGATAMPIVDALNAAGKAGLNIIVLFGHNHSSAYDDYLGGASIYLKKGDSMLVPTLQNHEAYENVALNFTYMNAGYVNNYADHGSGADTELTLTTFRILADGSVVINRYDFMGEHNLKSRGKPNAKLDGDLVGNETVYDGPRIVTAYTDEPYVEK